VFAALFFLAVGWWGWRTGGPMDGRRLSRRALGFAVVWFGASIVPVSNVVFISPVLVAERNLYLPSVAAAVGVGYLLALLLRERRAAGLGVAALLVLLGSARTWQRTPVWNDTWGAFDALLEDFPEAGRAWFFRGEKLVAQRRFAEARRAYAVALGRMESDYAVASLVASRLMGMGSTHRDAAEFLLLRAWREEPEHYTAPGHLAVLYLNEGRHEEGELFARRAVERAPENADMHRVLAAHLSGLGRHAEAIEERERALALEEEERWTWWVWLARDYVATGDTSQALLSLDSASVRAPVAGPGRSQIDSIRAVWSGGPSPGDGPPPAAGSTGSARR
jgi:tetratricopeptide (TPR) repeat protein